MRTGPPDPGGAGVEGRIVEGDLFSPPKEMLEAFDVVVSFGVVEHFDDTTAATEALGRFLVPGGTLVTVIPNLGGSLIALIQRFVNRPVFDVHVPLDHRQLADAHRAAGLELRTCGYFLGVNWNVVNIAAWRNASLSTASDARIVGDEQGGVVVGGARVTAATEPPDIAIRGGDCALVETRH